MAGRGMGCATRGGGAVGSGPKNKVVSMPEQTTGPVMAAKGGMINAHKLMAMGKDAGMTSKKKPKKMMGGGMMRGYKKGGSACK